MRTALAVIGMLNATLTLATVATATQAGIGGGKCAILAFPKPDTRADN